MAQNNLNNLCSIAQAANHLVTVQLMHEQVPPNNSGRVNTKFEHWCFVTMAPGITQNGNRTYDFQQSINMKYSLAEISGLSFVLKQFAQNLGQSVCPYTKFSKSASGQKTLSVWQSTKDQQIGQNNVKLRIINVTFNSGGDSKPTIGLSPDQAYGFASSLEYLYNRGMELELDRQLKAPRIQTDSASSNTPSFNQQKPNQNQNPNFSDQTNNQFSDMANNLPSGDVPF